MMTLRHKKASKNIGKSRTEKQALVKAGYSPSYARSGQIKKTAGWQELMERELPDEELLKVHKEGLKATKPIPDGEGFWPDYKVRREYLAEAYKTKGKYAPEKSINVTIDVEPSPEIKELAEKLNELYLRHDL